MRGKVAMRMVRKLFVLAAVSLCLFDCSAMSGDFGSPSDCFQATFGSNPTPAIAGLQGVGNEFRDSGYVYLTFRASLPTLKGLLGKNFHPVTRPHFVNSISDASLTGPAPPWWTPAASPTARFMASTSFHPSFSSGQSYASYDPKTQTVFLYWDGVD